ncbi:hydroxyproline O-arabinosyltransferase 2 [Brassica rapa]|nr:hydroxyproline O-arabinosyltransferase 2 [Brassica rapa]
MGFRGKFFFPMLMTLSLFLIIRYNYIVSGDPPLQQDLPGRRSFSSRDDVISSVKTPPKKTKRLFHTAVTATDSVYSTWQCRIMYYWYNRFRDEPGSEMGGYTRILHSGRPDGLMNEIPTFVANPLPSGVDQGYVVLNRPWAFVQWLQQAHIEEDYILMAEPDHIIVKPIPNLARGNLGAAFPFSYIEPKKYEAVLRKFFPKDNGLISKIDPIGNSPVIVSKNALMKIAPTWMNVSLAMKNDPQTDKAFGWVLEMYAYAVSSALHGVSNILHKDFMIQPPWDTESKNTYIIHYTYGCDFDMKGKMMVGKIGEWRFDKRSYGDKPPPRKLTLPPQGVPESVVTLVSMVNEATANIPNWES